jgi:hypothetical protein
MAIIRTNQAIKVVCKCGACVAATLIYGGVSIDEDFTTTMAEIINEGGEVYVVNATENPITFSKCRCNKQ